MQHEHNIHPHTRQIKERRIDKKARMLQIAAIVCAGFAAIGLGHGLHVANPAEGWWLPILAGSAAAVALALYWHVTIAMSVGLVRKGVIAAVFLASIVVTLIAVAASSQGIAVAVAGRSAVAAELTDKVEEYANALATAYAEATKWSPVALSAKAKATGIEMQAQNEAGGSYSTGKGCGPRCASLKDIAGAFANSAEQMDALLAEATATRKAGEEALTTLREAAARGDQTGFLGAASTVGQTIADLNAVDPRPIIESTGAVVVSGKGIDLTAETQQFQSDGRAALEDRKYVEVPDFRPLSIGEAVRRQAFGSAAHGWLMAMAIDMLPLFFLLIAFAGSRERWLNEPVEFDRLTESGRQERDEQRLAALGINRRDDSVVPFRQAAE